MYAAWSAVLLPRKSLFSVVRGVEEITYNSVQSQFSLLEWDKAPDQLGWYSTKWLSLSWVRDFVKLHVFMVIVDDAIWMIVWVPVPRPMSTFHCLQLSSLTCCPPGNNIFPARCKSCGTTPVPSHFSNVVPTWLPSCTIWRLVIKFWAFYICKSLYTWLIPLQYSTWLHSCIFQFWPLTHMCEWICNICYSVHQQLTLFHFDCLYLLLQPLIG